MDPMRDDERPTLSTGVEVHRVEDGCVVWVPAADQVHFLNETAMLVLDQCDGQTEWSRMQAVFEEQWGSGAPFDVREAILPSFESAGIIAPAA
jgi:hypothetical protein